MNARLQAGGWSLQAVAQPSDSYSIAADGGIEGGSGKQANVSSTGTRDWVPMPSAIRLMVRALIAMRRTGTRA
jgi:hypothetical protein